jgi:alpha-galactosidase
MIRHLQLFVFAVLTATAVQAEPAFWPLAKIPPMDWNSWDCFGTTLTEEQAKAEADAMVRYLDKAIEIQATSIYSMFD